MKNKIALLIVAMGISIFLYTSYLQDSKKKDIQNLTNSKLTSLKVTKTIILDTYLSVNKKYFYDLMHNEKVLNLLKQFKYTKSSQEKDILRGELYRDLYKEYNLLKELGVNQFHFHTYDGKSLLRFHAPEFNGDSLVCSRQSIADVVQKHKISIGLEGGKIYSGFRYVFPIIRDGDYLGSVEFSSTFDSIAQKLKSSLDILGSELILKKEVSYDKVFQNYKSLFIASNLNGNYFLENSSLLKGGG